MAWNRQREIPVKPKRASNKRIHGLIAGLIVAVGAVTALLLFIGKTPEEKSSDMAARKNAIRDVGTNVTANVSSSDAGKSREKPKGRPPEVKKDERGIWRYPSGLRWLDPNRKVVKVTRESRLTRLFPRNCDQHIASLLMLEPGKRVFGSQLYGPNLEQEFVNSLTDKLEIGKDDSPEDIELKKSVFETKKEIVQRIKNGENFVQILKDTRTELARLGAYREDLRNEIDKVIRNPDYTDADVKDFEKAANMMLEKEGLPPIKAPGFLVRKHLMERAKAKAENNQPKQENQE